MEFTKRMTQLETLIAKEEKKTTDRLEKLRQRLEAEQSKVKSVTEDMEGVKEMLAAVEAVASTNRVSAQRVLDFAVKKLVGETGRVVYRRKREVKPAKVVPAKKVPAKKAAAKASGKK